MNCFSMLKKYIGDKFFTHDPILPINISGHASATELKAVTKTEPRVPYRKSDKKVDEDDDLFKEVRPNYVAPRRVGAAMLVNSKNKSTSRFDMETAEGSAWEVEEFN